MSLWSPYETSPSLIGASAEGSKSHCSAIIQHESKAELITTTSMAQDSFISFNPNSTRREQELKRSAARSYAAHIVHRRRRASKKPSKHNSKQTATANASQEELNYSLTLMNGNSDPFDTFAVQITPRTNEILKFVHDMMLRVVSVDDTAIYQSNEHDLSRLNVQNALVVTNKRRMSRYWDEVLLDMRDRLAGLSRIMGYAALLSKTSPHLNWTAPFIAQTRGEAFLLLQHELLDKPIDSSRALALARQIYGFFQLACLEDDTKAVQIHGTILRKLFEEHAGYTEPLLIRTLSCDMEFAIRNAQYSQLDVSPDGWCCLTFEPVWRMTAKDWPRTSASERDIHENVFTQQLRDLIARARDPVEMMLGGFDHFRCIDDSARANAFAAAVPRELLDCAQLNCLHLDLVQGKIMRSRSQGFRHTQAAIVVAVQLLKRKLEVDASGSGVDHWNVFTTLLIQLQTCVDIAMTQCTEVEAEIFSEAHLWVLFVGTLFEIAYYRDLRTLQNGLCFCFSQLLAQQAQITGITRWDSMRDLAKRFLYIPFLKPDASFWYEDLINSPDVNLDTFVFEQAKPRNDSSLEWSFACAA